MNAPQSAIDALGVLGVELEPQDLDALGRYLDALYGANATMNLTAVPEGEDAWHRHVVDSLSLLPWVASTGAATAIDVGTGGGLPGIPLALAVPELRMTLLEATGRKCEFLQQCVADLGLTDRCPVVNLRAEVAGHRPELRERFDLCVSRAVARLPILLEYCIAAEIDESKKALHSLHAQVVESVRTPTGTIVAVEKLRGAPKMYPRGDGEPKRRPL
ncbi:MAG: methyltransferase gidb [Planctomycetota bacterium]